MNISQWKIGDRTFFSLEVDDRLLLIYVALTTDAYNIQPLHSMVNIVAGIYI